jgi:hypothetical protein
VSIRLNDAKMNMIPTFPSLLQLLTIDIEQGEEGWGLPRSSGRKISRGTVEVIPSIIKR